MLYAQFNPTAVVAWWGAILSTVVFLWDIYKYRHAGPKLRIGINAGMLMVPSADKRTFVVTEVMNIGDRPTTLTNLGLAYFEKRWSWKRLRNRATKLAVVVTPSAAQPFPWKLEPGGIWRGMTEQTPEIEGWAKNGVLYFDLYHSHRGKPERRRLTIA
jgi:hypothetical protein